MLERKVYRKPPLIEVFADFSFNDDLPWDTFKVIDFYGKIGGEQAFPTRKDREARSTRRRQGSGGRSLWQFLSPQGDRIVQVGPHRLVINQIPPYYGWERFRQDAGGVLAAYLAVWPPDVVESASLHYVDLVVLPDETVNLADYFNLYPIFPSPLAERLASDFEMACEFVGDAEGEKLVVSFQHLSLQDEEMVFRLQWDYVATQTNPAKVPAMIKWLDNAHERTSEAFRASLTPKCEALFEPE